MDCAINTWNNNFNIQNGWVKSCDGDQWFYKKNGGWMANYWVKHTDGKWYYLTGNQVMYDPKYFKGGHWYRAYDGNSSTKMRWFYFNDGGGLAAREGWKIDEDNWGNPHWIYYIPGNYGLATSETRTINGEVFKFDKNGYCYSGRGWNVFP